MNLGTNSYDIIIEKNVLQKANAYLNLDRKVLVVTDDGVPVEYAQTIAGASKEGYLVTLPQGENTKSFDSLQKLLTVLLENGFSRTDAVVAVGGGVMGDLAGFAAATFMRGIDFYNIPTTLLSMVDSSIGGKTAINLNGIKNCVGAFHQPKAVLVDPTVLSTLPHRQITNGLAEAIKMAATFDEDLFTLIENEDVMENLEEIIVKSIKIKKNVVEQDEKESGLRRVLNFGHTIGHGIESFEGLHGLYHGECVALGMLPLCDKAVKERLLAIYRKVGLPSDLCFDPNGVFEATTHDKKRDGDSIRIIYVPKIGSFEVQKVSISDFEKTIKEAFAK